MRAKIYRPSKTAMQSGHGKSGHWVLEYELTTARRPESLMGWVASGDTLNQVRLRFNTAEDAVKYAEKQGWLYTVYPVHDRKIRPRNYGDNFRIIDEE